MRKLVSLGATVFLAGALLFASPHPQEGRGKDGHFHDPYTGEAQPDFCDNSFKNSHPCQCAKAKEDKCDGHPIQPGQMCKTFCRTNDCHCVGACTS